MSCTISQIRFIIVKYERIDGSTSQAGDGVPRVIIWHKVDIEGRLVGIDYDRDRYLPEFSRDWVCIACWESFDFFPDCQVHVAEDDEQPNYPYL